MSYRPDRATSTSQKPRSPGGSPARGPRQSWRVRIVGFSRGLPSSIRTGSIAAGRGNVLEPRLVFGVHLGQRCRGAAWRCRAARAGRVPCRRARVAESWRGAGRWFVPQQLVRLRPRGEGSAELGQVAAVPLEEQGPIGPAGSLDSREQRQRGSCRRSARRLEPKRRRHRARWAPGRYGRRSRSTTPPAGKCPGQRM